MATLDEDVSVLQHLSKDTKLELEPNEREILQRVADRVVEYENAITWQTTCRNCSKLLDRLSALDLAVVQLFEENPELLTDPRFQTILKARG